MVSLLISRLGKVISGQTPEAMYELSGREAF